MRSINTLAAAVLCGVLAGGAGHAQANTLAGHVRVIDGDTIEVGQTRIRLTGIDAPESRQRCADGWDAGTFASRKLAALLMNRTLACTSTGKDKYGRTLAKCTADGVDVGAAMVGAGAAWAYVQYSGAYAGTEDRARAAGAGVHGHGCTPAWQWRAQHKVTP